MDSTDLIGQTPALYLDAISDRANLPTWDFLFDNQAFLYRSTHKVKGRIQRKSRISKPSTPSQVTMTLVCAPDSYRAGDLFVLHNFGPANGRWVVVTTVRNVLSDTFTSFTLEPPLAPYPEPQPSASTTAGVPAATAAAGQPSGSQFATTAGTFANPADAAQAALAQKTAYSYSEGTNRGNGGTLFGPAPRTMDCSAFATLCYKAASYPDPSNLGYSPIGTTGTLIANSVQVAAGNAIRGDLCFFGPSTGQTVHVTVYVGNAEAVSMGRQGDPSLIPATEGPSTFLGYWRPKLPAVFTTPPVFGPAGPLINP
jgi:hypothetical protein